MSHHKAYGSLNDYKLCSHEQKEGWGVSKIVLAAVFFAACLYFAMMVMSAVAAAYQDPDDQNKTTQTSLETRLGPKADPCLPLLRRAAPTASSAKTQSSNARAHSVPLLPGQTRTAGIVMAIGLALGARYALKPYTLTSQAGHFSSADQSENTAPLPSRKPRHSLALSVAAYRDCIKQVHLSMIGKAMK